MSQAYRMAQVVMDQAVASLQALGLEVPERRVIYMGQIPADCVQLAVVFGAWTPTPEQDGMTICLNYRWQLDFTVLLTRQAAMPTRRGQTPSVVDMTESAAEASNDADALLDLVQNIGEHAGASIAADSPQGGLRSTVLEISLPSTGLV